MPGWRRKGVPGEQGIPTGGTGEYQKVLLDGRDQDEGWCGISVRI